eukprot:3262321-Pyramimonas_sp.AAC.1
MLRCLIASLAIARWAALRLPVSQPREDVSRRLLWQTSECACCQTASAPPAVGTNRCRPKQARGSRHPVVLQHPVPINQSINLPSHRHRGERNASASQHTAQRGHTIWYVASRLRPQLAVAATPGPHGYARVSR